LVWRFRAAPEDRRLLAYEQLESVWPVHGSMLIKDEKVFFVAGRSNFLDGGMRWFALDARTGKKLVEEVLDEKEPGQDKNLQDRIQILQMPVGLPDILSADDKFIYMKSQKFDDQGKRHGLGPHSGDFAGQGGQQGGETAHVFCPTGFLDDTWFHRTYWVYGRSFAGGHGGYYQAGKFAPAGRLLVFDQDKVYGFGRKPQYYKWTTILEHQLFASDRNRKAPTAPVQGQKNKQRSVGSMVDYGTPKTLDPTNKALTIGAWCISEKVGGVVMAHGGPLNGYALVVQKGKPVFMVRSGEKLVTATGEIKITNKWVHLAGVLTKDKQMRLYVDGKLVAEAKAPGLVAKTPVQGLQIGADALSSVGEYATPFAFKGVVDEVRVYHRALNDPEMGKLADWGNEPKDKSLVLYSGFETGKATDDSGNKHAGVMTRANIVRAKTGKAVHFDGRSRPGGGGPSIEHQWTQDIPILVRAMAKAGDILLLMGPPDLVDEEKSFARLAEGDKEIEKVLLEQEQALQGKQGAILLLVNAKDGETKKTIKLHSLPIWDSLAVARENVFFTNQKGEVVCLGE